MSQEQAQVSNWCPTCAALAAEVERLRAALMDVTEEMDITLRGRHEGLLLTTTTPGTFVSFRPATIETVQKLREGVK